jgi:hypothetical protein
VIVIALLLAPTTVFGNVKNDGVSCAIAAVPVPLTATLAGLPVKLPDI